ncbi:hypothetical protein [Tessaracoccus sp. G1721]
MNTRRALSIAAVIALSAVFAVSPGTSGAAPPPKTVTYTDVAVTGAHDTHVTGVTTGGLVVGYYGDEPDGSPTHGFALEDVEPTTIDVPGAVSTIVRAVNDPGVMVGSYVDADGIEHGFVRDSDGSFVTFDDPALDGTVATARGTVATGINLSGVVVGYSYTVGPDVFTYGDGGTEPITRNRGFIRTGAVMASYDAPGAATSGAPVLGTRLFGINSAGSLVGAYTHLNVTKAGSEPMNAGFVVSGKKFTRIVDPSTTDNSCGWTEPHAVNDGGWIVGESGNGCAGTRGAWLLTGGKFRALDYSSGDEVAQDTVASSINNSGVIGGTWGNGVGIAHGFTATTR